VNPEGFLTPEEFALLDAAVLPQLAADDAANGETELPQ
jgi:hypothetical protein